MMNPIHKVLSTMRAYQVRCLLMGGQACILYGGTEFSRDVDFAVLASDGNLVRLRQALAELKAGVVAVPPFDEQHLRHGHAVHFRCAHPEALDLRIDVMSVLRLGEQRGVAANLIRAISICVFPRSTRCRTKAMVSGEVLILKKYSCSRSFRVVRGQTPALICG